MLFLATVIPLRDTGRWLLRRKFRRDLYAMAVARAAATGKPLLVVGDPDGGITHRDYGYGDVCIDLTGCPQAPQGLKMDLSKDALPFANGSHVVFVSYLLEYVPNLSRAWSEITRVAGDPKDVFVLHLDAEKDTSVFVLYPGTKWVIRSAPPNGENLVFSPYVTRLPLRRKV